MKTKPTHPAPKKPVRAEKRVTATHYKHLDHYAAIALFRDFACSSIYVLAATPEAYEAMVEQMGAALYANYEGNPKWGRLPNDEAEDTRKDMRVLLKSIGITTPAAQGRRAQR